MEPNTCSKKLQSLAVHQATKNSDNVVLGTARITIKGMNNIETTIRALCDNGSQVNLITQSVIQALNERPTIEKVTFTGIGGNSLGSSTGEILLELKLTNGEYIAEKFYVVKTITHYNPSSNTNEWEHLKGRLADEQFNKSGKIQALLGAGIWIQIIKSGLLKSSDGLAVAHKTKLGYVILENREDPYHNQQPYIGSVARGSSVKDLLNIMQKLWEVEELPIQTKRTKEEESCEQIFVNQHKRTRAGRYIVRIPFSETIDKLGKSKQRALHQFFAMEARMKRSKEFAEKYRLFMQEYETLGHMSQISEKEESGYYTPHHGVLTSGKFKVVFNASSPTTSGISLNETELIGEKLQRDLFEILISFRQFRIGIAADIEKMYRQVLIDKEDRKYQKIIWRYNDTEPIRIYQLNTITYGHACAPHCAIRALAQCAHDHENIYPRAAKLVKNDFYVDDLLTGAHDMREANRIKNDVTMLLRRGGFNITKWKTNEGTREQFEFKDFEQPSVLGLHRNLETDQFFYKIKDEDDLKTPWTKRKILSKIGRLYDPNGYLGPIIMKGKIIIQELWKNGFDWDEEVKNELKK